MIQGRAAAQMQAYLEAHGALPGGWDNATFRTQSNLYAWTLLRNTGRTNLTQAEFRALADDEWTQTWAQQGNAALEDVYRRQCGWVCRNKNWITPAATTAAAIGVSVLTGSAAAPWAAKAGYSTITTGGIVGEAGAAGGSLTAQTITGNYSLKQTLIDTAIGGITGGFAAKLTAGASGAATRAEGVLPKPGVSSPKLQNIVDDLYRGTTDPGRVGTGTTADAVRNELLTGQPTGGTFHSMKADQYATALEKVLKADLSYHDRLVAQSLLDDLLNALGGGS